MIVPRVMKHKKSWMTSNEDSIWTPTHVKKILKKLFETKSIDQWPEDDLNKFLVSKGLLNIAFNRHNDLLRNVVRASRSIEGMEMLKKYTYSDSETPPNHSEINKILEIETPYVRQRKRRNIWLEW